MRMNDARHPRSGNWRVPVLVLGVLLAGWPGVAQVPGLISYQGDLMASGTNFTGTGQFKFALVSADGSQVYWRNSPDTNSDGQPDTSVALNVKGGLFSVFLGNTNLAGMAPLPPWVFTNSAVALRIWVSDGIHAVQQLAPDQPIGSVAYALMAGNVPDASITPAKLATNTTAAVTAGVAVQISSLTAQLNALSAQFNTLSTQYSNALGSGLTLASADPQDASLGSRGFRLFGSFPAPAWITSAADGVPSPRFGQAGLWTGQEVIVWGGSLGSGTDSGSGGRYRPDLDTWQAISPVNAPSARSQHTAVWSGQEFLVWGGFGAGAFLQTGGRFNPSNQIWTTINVTNAPVGRENPMAAWTGSRFLVWGGRNVNGLLGNGGLYDPTTDQWSALAQSGAPAARSGASAVLAGNQLIVWGGVNEQGGLSSGAALPFGVNGLPGNWQPINTTNAPSGRTGHTAIWTGRAMLIWGGTAGGSFLGEGAAYNPGTDTWSPITPANAPTARSDHAAVWTGQEMLIWGGETSSGTIADGAAYDPVADKWRPLSHDGAPQPRSGATAVWSGSELIVFGGQANGQPVGTLQRLNPQPNWYLYRKP